jgi:two-component system phosphate regulon sensor histidine kinase PhoR
MRRAYALEEARFDLKATSALRKATADITRLSGNAVAAFAAVTQKEPGLYTIPLSVYADSKTLEDFLEGGLNEESLSTGFAYSLLTPKNGKQLYRTGEWGKKADTLAAIAKSNRLSSSPYLLVVYFPSHNTAVASGLWAWGLATLGLLAVIGFLGYLLFILFQQRQLKEVQKDFVTNMTHEFKTPLASIRLAADVLKNPTILQSPQRLMNYATIISDESAQLTAQVERVLQLTRVEKDPMDIRHEPVVWQDVLNMTSAVFRKTVEEKRGKLHLHLPEQPIRFTGDPQHLQNAVGNLIDNALKYCTESPEIHIFLKNFRRNIQVTVQDNGIGIDKQHQKMLFRKFYRVPTGNVHNVRGYGLGLNYVRVIAGAHGGTVECRSRPGAGTTFTMVFPG